MESVTYSLIGASLIPWYLFISSIGRDLSHHPSEATAYTVLFVSLLNIVNGCVFQPLLDWGQHNQTLQRITSGVIAMAVGTVVFHLVAVLFGAPLKESFVNTLLWSMLMSSMCVLPTAMIIGTDTHHWRELFLSSSTSYSGSELISYWGSVGGCGGAWLGAIPIPLDWDRPWQVWPIPCIYGAVLGYMIGNIGASAYVYWYTPNKINKIV